MKQSPSNMSLENQCWEDAFHTEIITVVPFLGDMLVFRGCTVNEGLQIHIMWPVIIF